MLLERTTRISCSVELRWEKRKKKKTSGHAERCVCVMLVGWIMRTGRSVGVWRTGIRFFLFRRAMGDVLKAMDGTSGGWGGWGPERIYTNTNCAPFLHIGHACPSCCPADSRRTHLPWQWGADSTVHLVARSIVPWPGQRKPSDWRIACVSQRTHTRSPADKNIHAVAVIKLGAVFRFRIRSDQHRLMY